MPAGVRQRVERWLGFTVDEAIDMPGGFTPGAASVVASADGRRAFVKAISAELSPQGPNIYRREAAVSEALPEAAFLPRLQWWFDELGWVVLAFEYVPGRTPDLRERADLDRVLDAVARMGAVLDPSPIAVPTLEQASAGDLDGWRDINMKREAPGLATFGAWLPAAVPGLARLEAGWRDATRGSALLHGDLRTDNMLLTPTGDVVFVDWPEACLGAAWVDLVTALPSFAMVGIDAEAIVRAHPLTARVPAADINALLAAIAGFFVTKSLLPPPPGLPTVRNFQRSQGREALTWLRRRCPKLSD